jgi:outer membrane receptor protein involved in Fe transport
MRSKRMVSHLISAIVLTVGAAQKVDSQQYAMAQSDNGAPRFLYASRRDETPVPIDVGSVPSLGRRIDLDLGDVTIDEALRKIESASGLQFVYSAQVVPLRKRVTVKATGLTVAAALTEVLFQTNVDVLLSNGRLVMVRGPKPLRTGTVSGRVTDVATRQPIRGATISLEGTRYSAVTGDSGQFRIGNVPAGTYALIVRRIGYAKGSQQVTITDQAIDVAVTLEASASLLDQVIVTGTIVPTEQRVVPNAITVISSQQIESRGITRLDQLFRGDVPGVFAAASNSSFGLGYSIITARGVSGSTNTALLAASAASNVMKTYVDGVEMSDPSLLHTIDPSMVDRVEIIPGPQASTMYGSGAFNGVMQVFTKKGRPSARPHITGTFSVGATENTFSSDLATNHHHALAADGGTQDFSYLVGGSYVYSGQYAPGWYDRAIAGHLINRYQHGPISADWTVALDNHDLGVGGSNAQWYASRILSGDVGFTAGRMGQTSVSYDRSNGSTMGLNVDYSQTPEWHHRLTLGRSTAFWGFIKPVPSYQVPSDSLLIVQDVQTSRPSMAYSTTLAKRFGREGSSTLTAGADYWRYQGALTVAINVPALVGTLTPQATSLNRVNLYNSGFFVQEQLGLNEALFFTAGVRAERNSAFGSGHLTDYSPRFGVSYTRDIGAFATKVRGAWGRAIRPPVPGLSTEQFSFSSIYGYYRNRIDGPALGPESQRGAEGGVELYYRNRATLILTHYDQLVDGLIAPVIVDSVAPLSAPGPYAQVNQYRNTGQIRNAGWEVQSTVNARPFSVHGTYSFMKSRPVTDGIPPSVYRGIPEHAGALRLEYAGRHSFASLSASFIGQIWATYEAAFDACLISRLPLRGTSCGDPRPPSGNPWYPMKPYTTMDAEVERDIATRLRAFVRVSNLTSVYRNDWSQFGATPGRTTFGGIRLQ